MNNIYSCLYVSDDSETSSDTTSCDEISLNVILYDNNTLLKPNNSKTECKTLYDEKLLYLNNDTYFIKQDSSNKQETTLQSLDSCKPKLCKKPKPVPKIIVCEDDCDDDSDCISIISTSTYESFDSCDDSDNNLLRKEIIRARVQFKNDYYSLT